MQNCFRILVVDDSNLNRDIIVTMIQGLGFEPDSVGTGKEAIEAISRVPYNLVLLDCGLPDMTGFSAASEIRRRKTGTHRLVIIGVTGNAEKDIRDRCLSAGMDDYLPKPFDLHKLRAVIMHWSHTLKRSSLDELRQLGNFDKEQPLARWIDRFEQEGEQRLKSLTQALADGDFHAMAATAHIFKSESAYMGACILSSLCEKLESLAASAEGGRAAGPLVDEIKREFERACSLLKDEKDGRRLHEDTPGR